MNNSERKNRLAEKLKENLKRRKLTTQKEKIESAKNIKDDEKNENNSNTRSN
ncbi:MAG: hypothetical protein J0H68_02445 [Sphingobacteriia bacterium]|nr:hypothetical protein [Sphingobacteriia bacterium]